VIGWGLSIVSYSRKVSNALYISLNSFLFGPSVTRSTIGAFCNPNFFNALWSTSLGLLLKILLLYIKLFSSTNLTLSPPTSFTYLSANSNIFLRGPALVCVENFPPVLPASNNVSASLASTSLPLYLVKKPKLFNSFVCDCLSGNFFLIAMLKTSGAL